MFFPRLPQGNPFMPGPAGDPLFMARPFISAWENAERFSNSPRPSRDTPIEIQPKNLDEGLKLSQDAQSITIAGTAKGSDRPYSDAYDAFERGGRAAPKSRGVRLGLDVAQAPTKNVWGQTDYSEKNQRAFYVGTRAGESANSVAQRLADAVKKGNDFRAKVTTQGAQATVSFERR